MKPLLMLAIVLLPALAPAGEPDADDDPRAAGWQAYFLQLAEAIEIRPREQPAAAFELKSKPVLRWSQPVRGGDDGATFVWEESGRPEVVGTIFAWPHPEGFHVVALEMHSLAAGPLSAEFRDEPLWSPDEAGLEWHPVPDAQRPADAARARRLQMRRLARRFSVTSTDGDGKDWPLRLLPQPLHRYQPADDAKVDGALYAFAQGTDPEAILVLEARKREQSLRWEYAFARFSDRVLRARLDEAEVWQVDRGRYGAREAVHLVTNLAERKTIPEPPERGAGD